MDNVSFEQISMQNYLLGEKNKVIKRESRSNHIPIGRQAYFYRIAKKY